MKCNIVKQVGFTLVEVLVALVILSLAFTASFYSFSLNARNYNRIIDKTSAQWIGMNVIALIQSGALKFPTRQGELTGTDEMLDHTYVWRAYQVQTEDVSIYKIVVDINKDTALVSKVTGYTTVKN